MIPLYIYAGMLTGCLALGEPERQVIQATPMRTEYVTTMEWCKEWQPVRGDKWRWVRRTWFHVDGRPVRLVDSEPAGFMEARP